MKNREEEILKLIEKERQKIEELKKELKRITGENIPIEPYIHQYQLFKRDRDIKTVFKELKSLHYYLIGERTMDDEEIIKEMIEGWKRENLCNYCGEKLYDEKHRGIIMTSHFLSCDPKKPKPDPKLRGNFHADCLEKLKKEINQKNSE